MAEMSPLRRRMIEDMSVRNLSPATQRSYLHAVSKFGRFFQRPPDHLDLDDVRTWQVHLVSQGISLGLATDPDLGTETVVVATLPASRIWRNGCNSPRKRHRPCDEKMRRSLAQ